MAPPDAKLDRFLGKLPEGFEYGVRERLEVRRLLLELENAGKLPENPKDLKTLLAPLVCSTREQQRQFYELFDAEEWGEEPQIRKDPGSEGDGTRVRRPRRGLAVAAAVVVVLGAGIGYVSLDRKPPAPSGGASGGVVVTPQVRTSRFYNVSGHVTNREGEPLKEAEVWIPGSSVKTKKDGSFKFEAWQTDPTLYLAADPGYAAKMGEVNGAPVTIKLEPWKETPRPDPGSISEASGRFLSQDRDPVALAIAPSGVLLAVGEGDGAVHILPPSGAGSFNDFQGKRGARLAFAQPAGEILSYTDRELQTYEHNASSARSFTLPAAASAAPITAAAGTAFFVYVAGDSQGDIYVVSGSQVTNVGDVWRPILSGSILEPAEAITLLPSSSSALIAGPSGFWRLDLRSSDATPLRWFLSPHSVPIEAIQVDATSRYLGVLSRNGVLDIWDAHGQRVRTPTGWPAKAAAFSFSDSNTLWTATIDRTTAAYLRPLRWPAALIPAAAIAAWLWRLYRKRARLNRLSIDKDLKTHSLAPPRAESLFHGQPAQRLGLEMRKRKRAPSIHLAPEPTVHATAVSAGFLTPVYAARSQQREFLILLKSHGPGDQQELLYRSLVKALEDEHALIDLYTFHSSPENILDRSGGWTDLSELSARHPDHDLWIIADPAEFLDPFASSLPDWTQDLARWQDRAIFSPVAVDSRLRVLLEEDGIRVSAASVEGFDAVLRAADAEHPAQFQELPALPKAFRYLPLRWVERREPAEKQAAAATEAASGFLGEDGMLLAGACSIYPETYWGLTLWLAERLIPERDRRAAALVRVTSLPWFRFRSIPNWMRARLANRLSEAAKPGVCDLVESYLANAERKTGDLAVASSERGRVAPVRDFVMLSFLLGLKVDERQAVKPPPNWMWMLYEGGRLVFGARLWLHALAAVVLGIGAWFAANGALALVPARIDMAQWKLPETALVPPPATRTFPSNKMRRAILEVADAMVGQPAGASFEDEVVRKATLFVYGGNLSPQAVDAPRAAPGLIENGGVIESVTGNGDRRNGAALIGPQGGKIARVEVAVVRGPIRDYSVTLTPTQSGGGSSGSPGGATNPTPTQLAGGSSDSTSPTTTPTPTQLGGNPSGSPTATTTPRPTQPAGGSSGAPAGTTMPTPTAAEMCGGPGTQVFDNWNGGAVSGGGNRTVFDTSKFGGPARAVYCLTSIATYHWNDGKGAAPGEITLSDDEHGMAWKAEAAPRPDKIPSDWVVNEFPDGPIYLRGSYKVEDASPETWSQNSTSGGLGFVRVNARQMPLVSDWVVSKHLSGTSASDIFLSSVAWSPDSQTLAAGTVNGIMVWDFASGKLLREWRSDEVITSVVFSPDGKTLAAADDASVRLWDVGGKLLQSYAMSTSVCVAWSPPDVKMLAVCGKNSVQLLDVKLQPLRTVDVPGSPISLAWSTNGRELAINSGSSIFILDAASGKVRLRLQGHQDDVKSVAWSRDGRMLASGSADRTAAIWDAGSGQLLRVLAGHRHDVDCVAWSPDGKILATASDGQTVLLWDVASGRPFNMLHGFVVGPNSIAWSPDGRFLAIENGGIDIASRTSASK